MSATSQKQVKCFADCIKSELNNYQIESLPLEKWALDYLKSFKTLIESLSTVRIQFGQWREIAVCIVFTFSRV
jgi:hypothetical protein